MNVSIKREQSELVCSAECEKGRMKPNIEDYRKYCLSLGDDVEEKLPFMAFLHASGVLVFYVCGHMFSFFDYDDFSVVTLNRWSSESIAMLASALPSRDRSRVRLKCQPERINELKAQYSCVGKPFNLSPKYWIGIDARTAPDELLQEHT